MIQEVHFDVSR